MTLIFVEEAGAWAFLPLPRGWVSPLQKMLLKFSQNLGLRSSCVAGTVGRHYQSFGLLGAAEAFGEGQPFPGRPQLFVGYSSWRY